MQKYLSEFFGTALLLIIVTSSGIMGEQLAGGNTAVALLANSFATGTGLYVLISVLSPISSHFNPVVTLMEYMAGGISKKHMFLYWIVQFLGAIGGVWFSHILFELPLLQMSDHIRNGPSIWISEFFSTLVLLGVIRFAIKQEKNAVAKLVALTVFTGYWVTSSTFFANPAVTLARSLTDTFVGIAIADVGGFILAQILATVCVSYFIYKKYL